MAETKTDRHKAGYYEEYAARTGKKDRHSADYYKKYRERKKAEKQVSQPPTTKKVTKDRKAYYRKYNQEHPERLNRGFTKGYVNGNVKEGVIVKQDFLGRIMYGYDEFGLPVTNDQFGDMLRFHEMIWHDDDWEESPWGGD